MISAMVRVLGSGSSSGYGYGVDNNFYGHMTVPSARKDVNVIGGGSNGGGSLEGLLGMQLMHMMNKVQSTTPETKVEDTQVTVGSETKKK